MFSIQLLNHITRVRREAALAILRDQAGGLTENTGVAAQRRPPVPSSLVLCILEGCQGDGARGATRYCDARAEGWHFSGMQRDQDLLGFLKLTP